MFIEDFNKSKKFKLSEAFIDTFYTIFSHTTQKSVELYRNAYKRFYHQIYFISIENIRYSLFNISISVYILIIIFFTVFVTLSIAYFLKKYNNTNNNTHLENALNEDNLNLLADEYFNLYNNEYNNN